MKSSYLPHATLAALSLAALLTVLAGGRMAREERVIRTEVGREEIGTLSSEMLGQLRRLDRLYEGHLRRLAESDLGDRFALRKACDAIVGVRQFAVAVDVDGGGDASLAFQENFAPGWRGVPILPGQEVPALGGDLHELHVDDLRGEKLPMEGEKRAAYGWIDRPGSPMMFWMRHSPGAYVIITPDPAAVRSAVHGWLGDWMPEVDGPVLASGAQVRIAGAVGEILPSGAEGAPDVVVPLRSRFGEWRVMAWDERGVEVSYHAPTLAISVGLAAMFALLGVGGFVVLRRALRLSEQRVSFVNRVSHELRTPLTNILLNNDLAADAIEVGDEPAASGRLQLVREEAGRLSRLIANVLTFSRSGNESITVASETFGLADFVEQTLAPFRASLGRKEMVVEVDVDRKLVAQGDPDLAAQVLANLVSNVEKYAAGGGLLRIVARRVGAGGDAGQLALCVSDLGPGIPEQARARVFEPFVRLSERVDEGVSGTGLGLAIARDLAEKMGGELRLLDSERGASFEFRLPLPPANVIQIEDRRIS